MTLLQRTKRNAVILVKNIDTVSQFVQLFHHCDEIKYDNEDCMYKLKTPIIKLRYNAVSILNTRAILPTCIMKDEKRKIKQRHFLRINIKYKQETNSFV